MINIMPENEEYSAPSEATDLKLYKRRWIIMMVFVLFAINGGMQWLEFSIISDIVQEYYNVPASLVTWTTVLFMLGYIVCAVPSIFLINKVGTKYVLIIASTGICIGAWIKVFSVNPERFYLVLIGQLFQAIFQVSMFGLAAQFTAIWFGANEISLAGSIALFGDQLGTALGFVLPPLIVKKHSNMEDMGVGFLRMNLMVAISSTIIVVIAALFFQEEPPIPPSKAQKKQNQFTKQFFWKNMKCLLTKRSFVLLMFSYGFSVGPFNSMATLLNQTVLINFPGHNEDAGNIGFVSMITGMFGSLFLGFLLDRNKLFKENAVLLSGCACASALCFTVSLKMHNIMYVYLSGILLGFFNCGYYVTGPQVGIEVTYPIPEGFSSTMMLFCVQVHGLVITPIYGYCIEKYGDVYSNLGICFIMFLSVIFVAALPNKMQRKTVEKDGTVNETEKFLEIL